MHSTPLTLMHYTELCAELHLPASASKQTQLSLHHGGLGFHSLSLHSIPAYVASVSHALSDNISPPLEHIHLKNAVILFNNLSILVTIFLSKIYSNSPFQHYLSENVKFSTSHPFCESPTL